MLVRSPIPGHFVWRSSSDSMAAQRRYKLPVIEAFRRQLRYARSDVLRKQALAAETLVFEVERERTYPSAWVVWRITGFRPENEDLGDALLKGEDLRHDLALFMQELAKDIEFMANDRPGGAVNTEEAARRLGVSVRTLQRWRDRGLPLIPIRFEDGNRRRGCYLETLERFAASESRLVEHARRFGRVPAEERMHLRDQVASRVQEGESETQVITDVARRAGRSPQTVRRAAACAQRRRLKAPEARRFSLRAYDRRIGIPDIAERLQRSESAIRRLILDARWQRVGGLLRRSVSLPTAELPDADRVFAAAGELDTTVESTIGLDLAGWIARIRTLEEDEDSEAAGNRIAALHFLNARAERSSEGLRGKPTARVIDAMERDLVWGGLLLERVVLGVMGGAMRRFSQSLGARFEELPQGATIEAIDLLLKTSAESVMQFDPGRKSPWHELHRSVGLAVAREVARHPRWRDGIAPSVHAGEAMAPRAVDSLSILPGPLRSIMGPLRWWRCGAGATLTDASLRIIKLRHGVGGGAHPRSMRELGVAMGEAPTHLQAPLLEAEQRLRLEALGTG